jgi:hypothetical protein
MRGSTNVGSKYDSVEDMEPRKAPGGGTVLLTLEKYPDGRPSLVRAGVGNIAVFGMSGSVHDRRPRNAPAGVTCTRVPWSSLEIPPTVRERAAPRLDSGMKLHAVMQLCAQTEYYASLPITSDHSQCRDNALSSASTYVIRSLPSYGSMEERHAAYRKRALRRAAYARRKAGVRNVGVQTG